MNLKIKIHQNTYSARLAQGVPFSDEFNENLDSLSVIVSRVNKMNLEPYDDVILYDTDDQSFKKHFLVANYNASMLNLTDRKFTYTIDLMSETKGLEKVILSNAVFKQPLVEEEKKTLYEVIKQYIETFTPKRKYSIGNHEWEYRDKYTLTNDTTFYNKTNSIPCPEFTFNAPTLRELLNFLFNVVDFIPVVRNNVVEYIDISKPTGTFSFSNEENWITYTKSADNFSLQLVKDYKQGIGNNSRSSVVEYIGFRNMDEATLKLDNLRLETNFPIYTINKVYMYLWRKIYAYRRNNNVDENSWFPLLVQFDITDFIVEAQYRNLLNPTYTTTTLPNPNRTNETTKQQSIQNAVQYQIMTLAFNRGQKNIDGWGYGWSFYDPGSTLGALGWVQTQLTFLENLINFLGYLYPYGQGRDANDVQNLLPGNWTLADSGNEPSSWQNDYLPSFVIAPNQGRGQSNDTSSLTMKLKSLLFKLDYQPLSSARVKINKKGEFNEEYATTDNQNTSMVVLETDGDNCLHKIARMANELLQINGRYTDLSHLLPLGAMNEDGYVIFKRTYSIYGNEIKANYAATKNYILKNYFTSIYAKVRNKTFMGVNESSTRNENNSLNIIMSKTELYNDVEKITINSYDPLFSTFSSSQKHPEYFINCGLIRYDNQIFEQEINSFAVGNTIMCFDMEMTGNITVGNYINEFWSARDTIATNKIETIGSMQSSYVVANPTTGFTDYIYFKIGNVSEKFSALQYNSTLVDIDERDYDDQLDDIARVFNNSITKKPSFTWNWQDLNFSIDAEPIWKNNGEIINYNFQFDYSNLGKGLYIGKEFIPLNEMFRPRDKEKVFETYYGKLSAMEIPIYFSVQDFTASVSEYWNTSRPVIVINIPKNSVSALTQWFSNGGSPIPLNSGYTYRGTNSTRENPPLVNNFKLSIDLYNLVSFSNNQIEITYGASRTNANGQTTTESGTFVFKRFSTGVQDTNRTFFEIQDIEGYQSYGWAAYYETNYGSFFVTNMGNGNPKFLYYGGQSFNFDYGSIMPNTYLTKYVYVPEIVCYNDPHYQNCIVFYNPTRTVDFNLDNLSTKSFTLGELTELGFVKSDLAVDDLFSLDWKNLMYIFSERSDAKQIAYFYQNANQSFTLVFACDFDEGLANRTTTLTTSTEIYSMFNGTTEKELHYIYPADDGEIDTLYASKTTTLQSLYRKANWFYFEEGHTYKFKIRAPESFLNSPQIVDPSLWIGDNYNAIGVGTAGYRINYTQRKTWDTVWLDTDSQDWNGLVNIDVSGITRNDIIEFEVHFYDPDDPDEESSYVSSYSANVNNYGDGVRFNIVSLLPYYPQGNDVLVQVWYKTREMVAEVTWTCHSTGYLPVYIIFRTQNMTEDLYIPYVSLFFFDNTRNLSAAQIDTLENGGVVTVQDNIPVYYQEVFVSYLSNLNNRVYDNDNLLIGMNKNCASDADEEVPLGHFYTDFVDNNDSED